MDSIDDKEFKLLEEQFKIFLSYKLLYLGFNCLRQSLLEGDKNEQEV